MQRTLRAGVVCALAAGLGLLLATGAGEPKAAWTQFGGPGQEFVAPGATTIAASWPESGPRKLWSRELGDGYSAILVEDGKLYTMYRTGDNEAVVCLDAESGKTLWEQKYADSPSDVHVHQFGDGPRATPVIAGDRLFAIGVAGRLTALDKKSGKVLWSHELWDELGGNVLEHGYSSSPLAVGDLVVALVGGKGASVVAFHQKDGSVAWKAHDYRNSYSSPRLFDVAGEPQVVAVMQEELIGLSPKDGALRWRLPNSGPDQFNVAMPSMADANHLFYSGLNGGAHGIKLTKEGETFKAEQIWETRKIQLYHVSAVRVGDWLYGCTGAAAPAFVSAVNIRTGEVAWRERGFSKANVVGVAGKIVILDEDGNLALATATPEGLTVHSRTKLLDKVAWTAPTIVGKRLYARDTKTLLALDLG